MNTVNTETAV